MLYYLSPIYLRSYELACIYIAHILIVIESFEIEVKLQFESRHSNIYTYTHRSLVSNIHNTVTRDLPGLNSGIHEVVLVCLLLYVPLLYARQICR